MTALERRNAILDALILRQSEKIENLAFEFSVNERTIRRDIDELSSSYPIRTECGKYGGVYIEPSYRTRRKYLKTDETDLLLRLSAGLTGKDREIMQGILSQFSLAERR